MKVYTKIILDKNNNVLKEDSYTYEGPIEIAMGIHYDFKSLSGVRAMKKKEKKEKKLAQRREKREAKKGIKKDVKVEKKFDESTPIDLNFLTNPDKK